jgi:hypothetical protein
VGLDFEFLTPSTTYTSPSQTFSVLDNVNCMLELTSTLPEKNVLFGLLDISFSQQINGQNFSLSGGGIKIVNFKVSASYGKQLKKIVC